MHAKIASFILAAVLALTSFATSPVAAAPRAAGQTVTVTDRDNNTNVKLTTGDTLVVRLAYNAGTGYLWQVARNNEELLAPQGEPAFEPGLSGIPGAQGTQVFTFTAKAAGSSGLMLLYKRPNQRGIQASHRFHLRVQTSAAQAVSGAKTMTLSDDDNNGSVTAAVGDTLVVSLASTPSTGYRWAVTDNVESILKPAGESYVRGSNAPGASGTQVFTFTVAAPGAVSFKMSYQRFNGTVARTWQVFVDVPQP